MELIVLILYLMDSVLFIEKIICPHFSELMDMSRMEWPPLCGGLLGSPLGFISHLSLLTLVSSCPNYQNINSALIFKKGFLPALYYFFKVFFVLFLAF